MFLINGVSDASVLVQDSTEHLKRVQGVHVSAGQGCGYTSKFSSLLVKNIYSSTTNALSYSVRQGEEGQKQCKYACLCPQLLSISSYGFLHFQLIHICIAGTWHGQRVNTLTHITTSLPDQLHLPFPCSFILCPFLGGLIHLWVMFHVWCPAISTITLSVLPRCIGLLYGACVCVLYCLILRAM